MKDYSLNKKEQKAYITDIKLVEDREGNESYEVTFADGRVFRNIEVDEENLAKIESKMQLQAKSGLNNMVHFIKERNVALVNTVVSGALSVAGVTITAANFQAGAPSLVVPITMGTVGVLALIPSAAKLVKNNKKLQELSKIKYLNHHKKTLESYKEYPNALVGLDKRTENYFREIEEPFLMIDLDDYSEKDLETIVDNISLREREYSFNYPKRVK